MGHRACNKQQGPLCCWQCPAGHGTRSQQNLIKRPPRHGTGRTQKTGRKAAASQDTARSSCALKRAVSKRHDTEKKKKKKKKKKGKRKKKRKKKRKMQPSRATSLSGAQPSARAQTPPRKAVAGAARCLQHEKKKGEEKQEQWRKHLTDAKSVAEQKEEKRHAQTFSCSLPHPVQSETVSAPDPPSGAQCTQAPSAPCPLLGTKL